MAAEDDGTRKRKPATKRHSFSRSVKEETDPEWRQWFLAVERKKKELADPKRRPLVFSSFEKDGDKGLIVRCRSEPQKLGKLVKREGKKSGRSLDVDLMIIESCWKNAVGEEIAGESRLYSFKNGVLTMVIFSSSLLQEIRQFHHEAILRDLRDIWQASVPLLKVVYKLGKRQE